MKARWIVTGLGLVIVVRGAALLPRAAARPLAGSSARTTREGRVELTVVARDG
jgi:hypothetical protein